MSLSEKLSRIQTTLKAPKNLYNKFGKYKYRNAEGICEAVKPYLEQNKCYMVLKDDMLELGGRFYIRATAKQTVPKVVEIPTMIKDSNKAAELLGKAYGIYTDKIEADVDTELNISIDYGDE